jgi:hypothetical protein
MLISIHFNKKCKDVMHMSMHCFCVPGKDMLNLFLGIAGWSSHESGLARSRGSKPALDSIYISTFLRYNLSRSFELLRSLRLKAVKPR